MELEDVAEKARRNLMAVASGILAVWALGIPLDGKLVGAVDLSAVEPWRAWIAALMVLTYFALRYHFAPTGHEAAENVELRKEWGDRRRRSYRANRDQLLKLTLAINSADGLPKSKGSKLVFRFPSRPEGENLTLLESGPCSWNGRHGKYSSRWVQILQTSTEPGMATVAATRFVGEMQN